MQNTHWRKKQEGQGFEWANGRTCLEIHFWFLESRTASGCSNSALVHLGLVWRLCRLLQNLKTRVNTSEKNVSCTRHIRTACRPLAASGATGGQGRACSPGLAPCQVSGGITGPQLPAVRCGYCTIGRRSRVSESRGIGVLRRRVRAGNQNCFDGQGVCVADCSTVRRARLFPHQASSEGESLRNCHRVRRVGASHSRFIRLPGAVTRF